MNDASSGIQRLSIVDAHVHLFDGNANTHPFLDQKDETYEALVPGYLALPKNYLTSAYLEDTKACKVEGIVWHEYLSNDAIKEARWGQHLAERSVIPMAMVALVDFLDPRLQERLDIYRSLPNVTAVREHLGWDRTNPLRRFAKRPDLLTDPRWQKGLERLREHDFKCGLEVFAYQLPDLLQVVRRLPEIGFTIAVVGWPLDLSSAGFDQWQRDLSNLSQCTKSAQTFRPSSASLAWIGAWNKSLPGSCRWSNCLDQLAACSEAISPLQNCPSDLIDFMLPTSRSSLILH